MTRIYPATQTLQVNQMEVTKRFIEQGLGISYVPYSMVERELQAGTLKMIAPKKITPPTSQTYVVTKVETEEALMFTRFLREMAGVLKKR